MNEEFSLRNLDYVVFKIGDNKLTIEEWKEEGK